MKTLFLLITTIFIASYSFSEKLTYDQKLYLCGNVKTISYQAAVAKKAGIPMSDLVDIVNEDDETIDWVKKILIKNISTVYELPVDIPSQKLADNAFKACFLNMDKFGN